MFFILWLLLTVLRFLFFLRFSFKLKINQFQFNTIQEFLLIYRYFPVEKIEFQHLMVIFTQELNITENTGFEVCKCLSDDAIQDVVFCCNSHREEVHGPLRQTYLLLTTIIKLTRIRWPPRYIWLLLILL